MQNIQSRAQFAEENLLLLHSEVPLNCSNQNQFTFMDLLRILLWGGKGQYKGQNQEGRRKW